MPTYQQQVCGNPFSTTQRSTRLNHLILLRPIYVAVSLLSGSLTHRVGLPPASSDSPQFNGLLLKIANAGLGAQSL